APFRAETTLAILRRVVEDEPEPIRHANPETPAWLADLIASLMAKDPRARTVSAANVADRLERQRMSLGKAGPDTSVTLPPRSSRRRTLAWLSVAAIVAITILTATELAGLTNLARRFLTPPGEPVVFDIDDPAVVVTIEADGKRLKLEGGGRQ